MIIPSLDNLGSESYSELACSIEATARQLDDRMTADNVWQILHNVQSSERLKSITPFRRRTFQSSEAVN